MPEITLRIDDEILRHAMRVARERSTTVEHMVRDFLAGMASWEEQRREQAAQALEASFCALSRDMGPRDWKREDLYER